MKIQQAGWQDLITDYHPDFIDRVSHLSGAVEFEISPWKITLDGGAVASGKSVPRSIRMTAQFKNPAGFKFSISRKSAFEKLIDTVTMTNGQFGFPKFEHDFVIHCNDKEQMKKLLSNPKITLALTKIPFEAFGINGVSEQTVGNCAPGTSEISLKIPGEINGFLQDNRRLTSLLELFKELLNQLCLVPISH